MAVYLLLITNTIFNMKKIIFSSLLCLLILSCKSSSSATSTKLDNKTEVAIKGNWKITSVTFPGSDYLKVTSFNIADAKCFEGSQWSFVSNNNKGNMLLDKVNCPSYSSNITWYVNKEGFMVVKFLTEGVKAKHTDSGYILTVANVNETTFQLVDKVNVGGKFVDVVYNFERK
jgi:hypothetical protein